MVTQEVDDIISSPVVKTTIIDNADCKILLDQRKYMNKFDQIQAMLGLSEKEKAQILSINLANDPARLYKEVWIGLGGVQSAVYATEVSTEEYLTFTTEEREKMEVFALAEKLGGSGADDLLIDLSSHYRESLTPKIELLRTAIAEHARVRFTYYYAKGVAEKCAEPYRIVFQWGDWYMFGWCPDAAGWRMYKLNRLTLLSVTAQTFEPRAIPPEALDFNARFHDGTLLRARVAASECYRLVEEYGPACYTRQPDGSLLLEIGYTNEDVAAAWLLGFGAKPRRIP